MKLFIITLLSVLFISASSFAAPKEEGKSAKKDSEEVERNLPKSGNLAGSYNNRKDGVQIAETWNDDSGEAAPLSASINAKGNGQYEAVVTNASEDTYYGYFEIAFLNDKGNKVKSSPFAATLKPKDVAKQSVMGPAENANVQVNLISWKNLSKKKEKKKDLESSSDSSPTRDKSAGATSTDQAPQDQMDMNTNAYNPEGQ